MKRIFVILGLFVMVGGVSAQDIVLPEPVKTGGMPLMDALNKRSSTREFSKEDIDNQTLSNLLWAAWGYNRNDKRTAPSANNKQEIDLYVVNKSGAYLYDAKNNTLKQVVAGDVRKAMGNQDFVGSAPLNVVFVANKAKGGAPATDCGFISQNIYLFCASENLGTVVRGWYDQKKVSEALQLSSNQEVVLTQTVGKKK